MDDKTVIILFDTKGHFVDMFSDEYSLLMHTRECDWGRCAINTFLYEVEEDGITYLRQTKDLLNGYGEIIGTIEIRKAKSYDS